MVDLIGQRLGQYEIVAILGQGGMATVYQARQESVQRDVAVKVINVERTISADSVSRFQREARTAAALSHPHIIKVFDYGQQDDLFYLVMELLRGGSLADQIRQGPLSPEKVISILDQIASALDYAHEQGIIHRDFKPQNVLLDSSGNAYLTDFGIARILSGIAGLTATGVAMGTPMYMSPEQWQGKTLDARTDIYALGVTLFEMLTGKGIFQADTPFAMMHKHLNEATPSTHALRAELPPEIDQVLAKATAKDPDQRFGSAGELAAAFRSLVVSNSSTITSLHPAVHDQTKAEPNLSTQPLLAPLPAAPASAKVPDSVPVLRLPIPLIAAIGLSIFLGWILVGGNFASSTTSQTGPLLLIALVPIAVWGVWQLAIRRPPNALMPTLPPVSKDNSPEVSTTRSKVAEPSPPVIESLSALEPGYRLGGYELRERLDRGENSRVYHALDKEMDDRDVAIKIMRPAEAPGELTARFRQEAQLLGRLQHAHIVPFYRYATENGLSYIVMPLLTGGSLYDRLRRSLPTLEQTTNVIKQIASALDYIHSKGVLHRDLKATNVIFNDQNHPYLVDFGIAKIISGTGALHLTFEGQILGEPLYMAPEQWTGIALTPASDQYSLGVLAYQMLTGRLPFPDAAPTEVMMNAMYEMPPKPSSLRPGLPTTIDVVIERVLAKHPAKRFVSATQFAEAFEKAIDEQAPARAVSTVADPMSVAEIVRIEQTIGENHVFISYSRQQGKYARSLADYLLQSGFNVWIDDQINYGEHWWQTIVKAIRLCGAMIVIMTPTAEESEWVQREIGVAMKLKKSIFPLLYTGDNWPLFVWAHYLDVRDGALPPPDFLDKLADKALRRPIPGESVAIHPS